MKDTETPSSAGSFDVVVIAASAGGYDPLYDIISGLPADFPASIIVVMHTTPGRESRLAEVLGLHTPLRIKEAEDGERLAKSTIYVAKPNRHLVLNSDGTLSLVSTDPVQFTRPAADVLFVTAAIAFRDRVIGIVLSGAGKDGAIGSLAITKAGGKVIAQEDPEHPGMPDAAIKIDDVAFVVPSKEIAPLLTDLVASGKISKY